MLNPQDYAKGAIVFDPEQKLLYKVIEIKKPREEPTPALLLLGDFNIIATASDGAGNYLIDTDGQQRVTTLDFTSSANSFKSFIRPAYFNGGAADLESVVAYMCQGLRYSKDYRLIFIRDRVGRFQDEKWPFVFWIFKDHILIKAVGDPARGEWVTLTLKEKEVIEHNGYFLYIDNERVNESLKPTLKEESEYSDEDLQVFLTHWMAQLQFNTPLLFSLLGWMIAGLFMDEVNAWRSRRDFPYFMIAASMHTGKTALMKNCLQFFGMSANGDNFTTTSLHVEMVQSSQAGNIPLWRDEFKLQDKALIKDSWMRSMYDRSSTTKGMANQGTVTYATNATLLLTGEDQVKDPATKRRALRFRLKKENRVEEAQHRKNSRGAKALFGFALPYIIKKGLNQEVFLSLMEEQLKTSNDVSDELMSYACVGAVFGKEIGLQAIATANEHQTDDDDKETNVEHFFELLLSYFIDKRFFTRPFDGRMPQAMDYFQLVNNNRTLYFKLSEALDVLKRWVPKDEYIFTRGGMGNMLKETFGAKYEKYQFRGSRSKLFAFQDLENLCAPLYEIIDKLKAAEEDWKDTQMKIENQFSTPEAFIS